MVSVPYRGSVFLNNPVFIPAHGLYCFRPLSGFCISKLYVSLCDEDTEKISFRPLSGFCISKYGLRATQV